MTKGCGNHGNGEVSDGIVPALPSFPRRRESRPSGDGNIQRLSESLEVLDSRFHGNDGMLWESRPLGGGNIQRLSESLEVLDSRFHGNDGMLRESWEWRNVSVITGMAKFQTALQVSEPM
ncbi:hypothetical protein [Neisseria meningitidis]|uniref:hypothetical protein n=1 Tax=Neisseria meningitidis TaxID=487 RepID=UPI00067DBCDA|nr:hypothetical protein [Neisseria meningitidis]